MISTPTRMRDVVDAVTLFLLPPLLSCCRHSPSSVRLALNNQVIKFIEVSFPNSFSPALLTGNPRLKNSTAM